MSMIFVNSWISFFIFDDTMIFFRLIILSMISTQLIITASLNLCLSITEDHVESLFLNRFSLDGIVKYLNGVLLRRNLFYQECTNSKANDDKSYAWDWRLLFINWSVAKERKIRAPSTWISIYLRIVCLSIFNDISLETLSRIRNGIRRRYSYVRVEECSRKNFDDVYDQICLFGDLQKFVKKKIFFLRIPGVYLCVNLDLQLFPCWREICQTWLFGNLILYSWWISLIAYHFSHSISDRYQL